MQNLNTPAQLTVIKNAYGIILHGENIEVTWVPIVGEQTHKDLEKGNSINKKSNTLLNGSSSYIKNVECKIEISLDNKLLSHFILFWIYYEKWTKTLLRAWLPH